MRDSKKHRSTLRSFTEIEARPIKWLWRYRIALGKLIGLAGKPKVGKGLLWSYLIAKVTRGELDGDLDEPRNVIVVTTEDEPGDTLKPRLLAAGADLSRVAVFSMGAPGKSVPFRVPQDADELGRRIAETKAALVVIDPLIEFVDGKADTHKSQDVRQALAALNEIARTYGCAILAVIHLNKSRSTDAHQRHEASAAFTQVMRGTMLLGRDPDDPAGDRGSRRVLATTSSNLGPEPHSLSYDIEPASVTGDTGENIETARIVPIGVSLVDGAALLGAGDDDAKAERDEAVEFLRVELAEGKRSARSIQGAAKEAGIGPGSLKRAKRQLGIRPKKEAFQGGWVWELPERDGAKGTAPPSVQPSPSSPSAVQAESSISGQGENAEGDGGTESGTFAATEAEEAEADRISAKFEGGK
jgi:putative DNA primase/helicase